MERNISKDFIKEMLSQAGITMVKAVEKYNSLHPDNPTTPASMNNKLARGSITLKDTIEFAEAIGFEVMFCPIDDENTEKPILEAPTDIPLSSGIIGQDEISEEIDAKFRTKLTENFVSVTSPKFDEIIIAGYKADLAAKAYIERISKEGKTIQLIKEAKIQSDISKEFDVMIKAVL